MQIENSSYRLGRGSGGENILDMNYNTDSSSCIGATQYIQLRQHLHANYFHDNSHSKLNEAWTEKRKKNAIPNMWRQRDWRRRSGMQVDSKWGQEPTWPRWSIQTNAGTTPAVRLSENMPTPVQVWAGVAQATIIPSLSSCFASLETLLNKVALLSCIPPSTSIIWDKHSYSCSTWHIFSQNTLVKPEISYWQLRLWLTLLTATQINGRTIFQNFHSCN